jgi:hypothetical protein
MRGSVAYCKEKLAVGPWGKCDTVRAVGVPLCSWSRTMSLSPPDFALSTRLGRTMFPRFRRIDVGSCTCFSIGLLRRGLFLTDQ